MVAVGQPPFSPTGSAAYEGALAEAAARPPDGCLSSDINVGASELREAVQAGPGQKRGWPPIELGRLAAGDSIGRPNGGPGDLRAFPAT